MNWTEIQNTLQYLMDDGILNQHAMADLNNEILWQRIQEDFPRMINAQLVDRILRQMTSKKADTGSWHNFALTWFRNLGRKIAEQEQHKAQAPKEGRCGICQAGSPAERERHIKERAIHYYTHYIWEQAVEDELRDIPWALELIYNHARSSATQDRQIQTWAMQAITNLEGWPTKPNRLMTTAEQHQAFLRAQSRGMYPRLTPPIPF